MTELVPTLPQHVFSNVWKGSKENPKAKDLALKYPVYYDKFIDRF